MTDAGSHGQTQKATYRHRQPLTDPVSHVKHRKPLTDTGNQLQTQAAMNRHKKTWTDTGSH